MEQMCGPRIEHAAVAGNRVDVILKRELMTRADWTTHDYNVHFCVGLANDANEDTEALVCVGGRGWDQVPDRCPLLYASDGDGAWQIRAFEARSDLKKNYTIRVPLAPGERIFIANTLPRLLDPLVVHFDELGTHSGALRTVYGHSGDGRDLIAYVYGDPARQGTLLVTSGLHPPEPDTLATAAIMDWLGTQPGRDLLEKVSVVVVPIANPDGYSHQTQGSNASGVNLFWDFRAEDERKCPEAAALWRFVASFAPRGYIDFHAYTFQLDKEPGPYCKPRSFYRRPEARRAAQAVYGRLLAEKGTLPVYGFSSYAPTTLGQRLTRSFDTLSIAKYHLHLKEGAAACAERGLKVFQIVADELIANGLATAEHGSKLFDPMINRLRILWAGLIRPNLGLLRRARFAEINLRRYDLVQPK